MQQPIIIEYENGDIPVHLLPSKPFCTDATCPCHHDLTLIECYLLPAIERGITWPQAKRIWQGELPADFDISEIDMGLLSRQDTLKTRSFYDEDTDPDAKGIN